MQPTFYIPHGGGPCFFMDWNPPDTWDKMRAFLAGFITGLPERPREILLLTAHWEMPEITLSTNPAPDLLFDYYGFPPQTYQLTWPAPGAPDLASRAARLLNDAGIDTATDATRGYDHGVFIPLKVALPKADIAVTMMSLRQDLDPEHHIRAGQALAPLRDQGVLIIGSGMSYHNMQAFRGATDADFTASIDFDRWLTKTLAAPAAERAAALANWAKAPGGTAAHPREEHLAPVFLIAGAAGDAGGKQVYHEVMEGLAISAYQFG